MKKISLGDAYAAVKDNTLTLANKKASAVFSLPTEECRVMSLREMKNVSSKFSWTMLEASELFNIREGNGLTLTDISLTQRDNGGMSERFIVCALTFKGDKADIRAEFSLYPGCALFNLRLFAKKPENEINEDRRGAARKAGKDSVFTAAIPLKHYKLHRAELFDNSDYNNTYVREETDLVYTSGYQDYRGHYFILDSFLDNEGLIFVREAPSRFGSQNVRNEGDCFLFANKYLEIRNSGYPDDLTDEYMDCYSVTFGCGGGENVKESLLGEYRRCYRHVSSFSPEGRLVTISNTWGDRSGGKNINEAFMLREIEHAARLGVDIVQVDAGYNTKDYRPDPEKFPQGFDNVMKLSREKGTEFGIWFEPTMSDNYDAWEKDADFLIDYYRNDGVTHMKVDAVTLKSRQAEENLRRMFEKFYANTEGKAQINNDITASKRFGFIYNKEYANLFVANRYTAYRSYYPHYTLRGLWLLSRYVPLRRLLTEVPNRKLFSHVYLKDDPFAPKNYEMDYLFAVAAFSNPLIWMEMYNLDNEDSETLASIISAWKPHAEALYNADVIPVGEEPDGIGFSGFDARTPDGGYLLLFCGILGQIRTLDIPEIKDAELLYASKAIKDPEYKLGNNSITVNITPKSFVFMKYKK